MMLTKRVPVHLICGFLGSGKTTLLLRILAEQPAEERLVLLVNEFGELGIDGKLLEGYDSEVRELASGCICCTLKADFQTSLDGLLRDFSPHRIVVEATGIAEAGELAEAVRQVAARTDVRLASVTTVVDAENFKYREMFGDLFFNQIRQADLLVLNKIDLVSDQEVEELSAALADVNSRARIIPVVHSAVDRATIMNPLPSSPDGEDGPPALKHPHLDSLSSLTRPPGQDHDSTTGFQSFAFQRPGVLDRECFESFMRELPFGVFRLKGFVRFEQGAFVVNYTYQRPEIYPTDDHLENRLAFVAWRVDSDAILARLEACWQAEEKRP